jgi:hypothetical protein
MPERQKHLALGRRGVMGERMKRPRCVNYGRVEPDCYLKRLRLTTETSVKVSLNK